MAGLAVTLESMGLYATLSAQVAGRMREIGIRIALGAGRLRVVGLVVRWVVLLVGGGLGIGLAAAAVASRGLRGLLFAVSPTDVGTYASVCVLLIVISLCAALRPAHRAARVDPLVVLKEE
jgi:ABC-type antimicrobial peptide transport system permease subunit